MLALLNNRGRPPGRGELRPHVRAPPARLFRWRSAQARTGPARIGTLRDKLTELERCGVQQVVVLPFSARLAAQTPEAFINEVLVQGLGARYVLVGDDFRFGAKRAGDYAMLDAAGQAQGFDVARMNSYEVRGLRVSSSAVRQALGAGDMDAAAALLGRPYTISGHVVHGRELGRALGASADGARDGFRTLNLRFAHWKPAASGIFAVLVHGLGDTPPARRGQPGHATVARPERCEWRPRTAGNPFACNGRTAWAPRGRTVKSSAWNFCTNCTTSSSTTVSMPSLPVSPRTAPMRAPTLPLATPARTPRPGARLRATEF